MAWSSVGFDGTINEAQWSALAGLLGNGYVAAGNGDCLVTAVGGARSVSVAAGSLYGDGVLSTNSGAETVAMTTPVNGQWYVIALRRTWATNTAALVAIAGATTTTTTPTAPPSSFPTLNTNVGVLTDQPIAWAWCNSANTTVVVYDIRLKAVKSLPPVVATSTERDAKFMSPTQGLQVWRNDLGVVETYYGLYDASTNPGGRDTAGWYVSNRNSAIYPMKPTSAVIASGTGSANALGTVSFSAATSVSLNGVFTSAFKNYKIHIDISSSTGGYGNQNYLRLSSGGTISTASYFYGGGEISQYQVSVFGGDNDSTFQFCRSEGTYNGGGWSSEITVYSPALVANTRATAESFAVWNGHGVDVHGLWHNTSTAYDGFRIYPAGGTMTGTITVYGIEN